MLGLGKRTANEHDRGRALGRHRDRVDRGRAAFATRAGSSRRRPRRRRTGAAGSAARRRGARTRSTRSARGRPRRRGAPVELGRDAGDLLDLGVQPEEDAAPCSRTRCGRGGSRAPLSSQGTRTGSRPARVPRSSVGRKRPRGRSAGLASLSTAAARCRACRAARGRGRPRARSGRAPRSSAPSRFARRPRGRSSRARPCPGRRSRRSAARRPRAACPS